MVYRKHLWSGSFTEYLVFTLVHFLLMSALIVSKPNLSTSFSTTVNAKELICSLFCKLNFCFRVAPHAHIPRHPKHTVSQLLRFTKDLLHFANSHQKEVRKPAWEVLGISSHVGAHMYQLHFERPASNPMHLFLLWLFFIIFLIFIFIYLPTSVSIYRQYFVL